MTAATTRPAAARFEPRVARRKLSGTIFLGACVAAIGILLIALVALLVDVIIKGVPWLDVDFLTAGPSRRAESGGHLPALVGGLENGLMVGVFGVAMGGGAAS
jgi:phosphate transport system permease protein